MDSRQRLSTLLKDYNLRPRKGLGQNFLADPVHLARIVDTAGLTAGDTVLEIGPGPGSLTVLLVQAARQVVAVELDPHMVGLLRRELGHFNNLAVVEADILQADIGALMARFGPAGAAYKVVANLPYYITSAVIRRLLETQPRPERMVITVQKEVAQRIVAGPGDMSLLAVSVQVYGRPQLVFTIPAGAFYPPPKVDSAVVRIDTYDQPAAAVSDLNKFFRVVKAGFSQKRKQLKNSLAASLPAAPSQVVAALEQAGLEPTRRAETLSLAEWSRLTEALP